MFSSTPPSQTQDRASGSLTTPLGQQETNRTPCLHIWSVFVVQLSGDLQLPRLPRRWLVLPLSSHSSLGVDRDSKRMEVEEEGQREEGRMTLPSNCLLTQQQAWAPAPTPGTGMCHTGSPNRCFFFFTGFRGVGLWRSSSMSDSSISSSAEIRISDSDSSWDAALR